MNGEFVATGTFPRRILLMRHLYVMAVTFGL